MLWSQIPIALHMTTHTTQPLLESRRIVITGGAGFIGHHSVLAALANGAEVLVIDDLRHPAPTALPPEVELVDAELATEHARAAITAFRPDAVLHLAAQGGVIRSFRDPVADVEANVRATVALIAPCRDAGTPRIVFASSGGALYGHADVRPTPEDTPKAPISPYGLAKHTCEQYLALLGGRYGITPLALRYGNVYGPLQDGTGEAGVVAISSLKLLAGAPPEIYGDGMQTRDFVFVGDIAEANILALASRASGAVNIATGIATPVKAVVEHLIEASGSELEIVFHPERGGEVRDSALDVHLAKSVLNWAASTLLSEGLRTTFTSFQSSYGTPQEYPAPTSGAQHAPVAEHAAP